MYKFVKDIIKLLMPCRLFPVRYFIDKERRIIYIINFKVACTSIKNTFLQNGENHKKYQRKQAPHNANEYFIFTFVRNPFDRLVSCYENKINGHPHALRNRYLWVRINKDEGFASFASKVCRIPDRISDMHFRSQSFLLYASHVPSIDFIGRFENITKDFANVQNNTGLAELPQLNTSGSKKDWREYYTPELARVVYERYKDDFEKLGYEDEYEKLLKYLESR